MNLKQDATAKLVPTILIVVLILFFCSCDPGIHYQPKENAGMRQWAKSVGLLDIQMTDIGGLIGETWLAPEMTIHNRAKSAAVIEEATLRTKEGEYKGKPFREGESKWAIVPANEKQTIVLYWEFDNPIHKVLKDPVELRLRIRVDNDLTEIDIPMMKFN